jgi:hypothetical protein
MNAVAPLFAPAPASHKSLLDRLPRVEQASVGIGSWTRRIDASSIVQMPKAVIDGVGS